MFLLSRARVMDSNGYAVTHFSADRHNDLENSHTRLLRCEQLPRFGALEGWSKHFFLPNHAEWKSRVVQSCTCINSSCTNQTRTHEVVKIHFQSSKDIPHRPSDGLFLSNLRPKCVDPCPGGNREITRIIISSSICGSRNWQRQSDSMTSVVAKVIQVQLHGLVFVFEHETSSMNG